MGVASGGESWRCTVPAAHTRCDWPHRPVCQLSPERRLPAPPAPQFIDDQPQQAYCSNVSLYALPDTQPIDRADPVLSLQVGARAAGGWSGCAGHGRGAPHACGDGVGGTSGASECSHGPPAESSLPPLACAALPMQDGKFCPTSQPAWSAFREAR